MIDFSGTRSHRALLRTLFLAAAALSFALAGCDDGGSEDNADGTMMADATGSGGDSTGGDGADTDMTPANCGAPSGLRPPRISEHAGAYDPEGNQLIMFGGSLAIPEACNVPDPTFEDETWIYDVACDNWTVIEDGAPGPRVRHMAAFDTRNRQMYIFGGRFRTGGFGSPYTLYNDMWLFDVASGAWAEVSPTNAGPGPRVNSAFAYDDVNHQLILFGGNESTSGSSYAPLADTWTYDIATNTWTEHALTTSPPARLFTGHVWDSSRQQLVVYGGADVLSFSAPVPYFNDTWALRFQSGTPVWQELPTSGDIPDGRFWSRMVHDTVNDRYVLFGGHDEASTQQLIGNRNDLHVLLPDLGRWDRLSEGDVFANPIVDVCAPPADFVTFELAQPERRNAHVFVATPQGALMMGGKTDCGVVDDLQIFDFASEEWSALTRATLGEACVRRGGQNCSTLCL